MRMLKQGVRDYIFKFALIYVVLVSYKMLEWLPKYVRLIVTGYSRYMPLMERIGIMLYLIGLLYVIGFWGQCIKKYKRKG
ncbi:MAG: hypothetical protein ACRDDX_11160 [Cellulosilyticaceae bacterium]